jgi:hypothetical protein
MTAAAPGKLETSATYVGAVVRALKKVGQLEAVIGQSDAATAQMLRSPNAQRWWGQAESFAMTNAIAAVGGDPLVKRVGHLAVVESISVVIRPLVGVLMAISGPSPSTLFSRFGQISETAVRAVTFRWTTTGPTSGELVISYPAEVPAAYVAWWLGAFDFVWETTKKKGTVAAKHEGVTLRFAMHWAA